MTTGDIILHIFCLVDDSLPDIPRHSQAKLYPSELVTIGILFASERRSLSSLLSLATTRLW
jgi:hypothetical protein